jgi:hypothetical protein
MIALDVNDAWVRDGQALELTLTYLRRSEHDGFRLRYRDGQGALRQALVVDSGPTDRWQQATATVTGLAASQAEDLLIERLSGDPRFHMVEIRRASAP